MHCAVSQAPATGASGRVRICKDQVRSAAVKPPGSNNYMVHYSYCEKEGGY